MKASINPNTHRDLPGQATFPKLISIPEKPNLHLVSAQGQLQIHTASYRGSFSVVLSEALRAAGLGSKVLIAQFLKGGVNQGPSGAVHLCGRLEWLRPDCEEFITQPKKAENCDKEPQYQYQAVDEIWNICKNRLDKNEVQKVVLDEIGLAVSLGFITENDLISTLNNRPASTDIILTGPSIPEQIMEMADQVTELRSS